MEQTSDPRKLLEQIANIVSFLLLGVFDSCNVTVPKLFPSSVDVFVRKDSYGETFSKTVSLINKFGQDYWIYPNTEVTFSPNEMLTEKFLKNNLFTSIRQIFTNDLDHRSTCKYNQNLIVTIEKFFNPTQYLEKEDRRLKKEQEEKERLEAFTKRKNTEREENRLKRVQESKGTTAPLINRRIMELVMKTNDSKRWIPTSERSVYCHCTKHDADRCYCCGSDISLTSDMLCVHTMMQYAQGIYNYSNTGSWYLPNACHLKGFSWCVVCDLCHDKIVLVMANKIKLN